jgi:methylated-DNA-protein-cysteine methyltransferase-like protein
VRGRVSRGDKSASFARGDRRRPPVPPSLVRRLMRAPKSAARDNAIRKTIRQIPRGKVATYSQVAAAAGYPMYHRQVAQLLRGSGGRLPWQRVVGAGGQIKLKYEAALEQRMRLEMEGVRFRGKRIDMAEHQHRFRPWEFE